MKVSKKQLNSIGVALMLSVDPLCYALPALGIGTFYRIMYLIETVALAFVVFGFLLGNKRILRVKKHKFGIVYFLLLCVVYIISYFRVPNYSYPIDQFLYCFAIGVLIISTDYCVETVLTIMTMLSSLIIPAYSVLFAYQWESLNQANMGTVYALLIWVVAALCHFIYYRQNRKKLFYLFYVPSIIGLYGILQFANRGAALSLVTLMMLVLFNRKRSDGGVSQNVVVKKRIAIFVVAVLGYIVILNFNNLFAYFYDFLNRVLDDMPSFFVKMNQMIAINDISNGRTPVYEAAIEGIKENFLFGNGIESFPSYTLYLYPHNFLLQLVYEGGIFFCVIPLIAMIWICYKLFFTQIERKDCLVLIILLFVQVVPRFLVSATIWRDRCFWLLIFYIFAHYKEIKGEKILKE